MKKRILAGVLALALTFTPFASEQMFIRTGSSLTVQAEEVSHIWDGSADTDWYYAEHRTEIIKGVEWSFYEISTPEQLAGLSKLVRNGINMERTTITLTSDITLNDTSNYANWDTQAPANNWTPIGAKQIEAPQASYLFGNSNNSDYVAFSGIFDGMGHTIRGLYCAHDCLAGLFASNRGMITRVHVADGYVTAITPRNNQDVMWNAHAGGISARSERGIFNLCEYDGYVYAERNGYPSARLAQCVAGGIVGCAEDSGVEDLLASIFMFGAVGLLYSGVPLFAPFDSNQDGNTADASIRQGIYNCISRSTVQSDGGDTGGILGWGNCGEGLSHTLIVKNCLHEGEILSSGLYGAIVGRAYKFDVKSCYYHGADKGLTVDNAGDMDSEETTDYEAAGMTKAEVAEAMNFAFDGSDIQLDYHTEMPSPPIKKEEDTTTEATTEATTESTEATEPLAPIVLSGVPELILPTDLTCETIKADLSWTAVSNATSYQIQVAYADDFSDLAVDTKTNSKSISLNLLHYGRSYSVRVRAVAKREADGELFYSDWSTAVLTIPDIVAPQLAAPELSPRLGYLSGAKIGFQYAHTMDDPSGLQVQASYSPDMTDLFADYSDKQPNYDHWLLREIDEGNLVGRTIYVRARRYMEIVDQVFYSDWTCIKLTLNSADDLVMEPFTPVESAATEEPATEEPATEEPTTEEPATEEPATEEPATEQPATEESTTEQPTTEEPATEESSTEQPAAHSQKLLAPCVSCYMSTNEDAPVILFKWNVLDGITGYACESSEDETFANPQTFEGDATYSGVRQKTFTPGKTYYFRIRSYVETENGREYSDYATTQITPPAAVENAELTAPVMAAPRLINDNKYVIGWTAVEGADSYEIDTAADPAFENCIRNDTEPARFDNEERTITGFVRDRVYYYRVRAVKESENGKIYSDYAYVNLVIPSAFELLHGDADSSTNVDASDAANILIDAAMVGSGDTSTLTNMQSMAADVNGDGIVNATDAAAVLMYAASVGAGISDVKMDDFI